MTLFPYILVMMVFASSMVQAQESVDDQQEAVDDQKNTLNVTNGRQKEAANFEFGLGYGLVNEKSLFNIDFKINIPLGKHYATQLLLNSNYLVTGSSADSFAQSELSSNWFARNDYGRLGAGFGVGEVEPKDQNKAKDRALIGRLMGDLYLGEVTLVSNYASYDRNLSNTSGTRLGISYYLDDDTRLSFYREKFSDFDNGWRFETYYQPKKYQRKGSLGVIARKGDNYDYLGFIVQYYFDKQISLKQRERRYH